MPPGGSDHLDSLVVFRRWTSTNQSIDLATPARTTANQWRGQQFPRWSLDRQLGVASAGSWIDGLIAVARVPQRA